MAESKKILSKEIIQDNLFGGLTGSAKEATETVTSLEKALKSLIKVTSKEIKSTPLNSAENIRKVTKDMADQKKTIEAHNEVKKIEIELMAKAAAAAQLQKEDYRQLVKLKKAQLILEQSYRGELEKLNAKLVVLRTERNNLNKADKDYQKTLDKLNKAIEKNTKDIIDSSDKYKKAKMNVGNYSESIKDALGNTGLFNGTLGQISNSLKGVIANFKAADTTGAKLSTTLKGITAIGIVGLIAGLTAAISSSQPALDWFALKWAEIKDKVFSGVSGGWIKTGFAEAVKGSQALKVEIRELNAELQRLSLEAEDYNEIANDTTLSFQKREENLKKFQETRLKVSEKALEIAKKEYNVAKANADAGRKAKIINNDLLDAEAAALLKVKAAEDDVQDSTRISDTENRQLNIARITQEVELLRSKKKSSTASIEILKQQIADEKRQITQRESDLLEFNQINKDTYEEQIKRIEEGTGVQIDQVDLLREKDNQAFAEKIKNLKLGVELTALVATVVKKAQDAELQGAEQLAKIEEDKVKRNITILNIRRDIAKITREDDANDLELKKSENELNVELLKNSVETDLFNKQKQKDFKDAIDDLEINRATLQKKRLENLDAERIDSLLRADEEISDLEIRAEKKLQIQAQYEIDRNNIIAEGTKSYNETKKLEDDLINDIEKKRTQALLSGFEQVTNGLQSELDKRNSLQQDAYDKEIEMRKDAIDRQQELAEDGLENQLAFEKAQQAKSELARKDAIAKAQKQKEQAQLVELFFNSMNARLAQDGANSGQAAAGALGDVLLAKGYSRAVMQFAMEGNDNVQALPGSGGGSPYKDDIPFMLNKEEGVVKASANKENKGVVKALNAGKFSEMYIPKASFEEKARDIERSTIAMANEMLFKEYTKQTKLLEKIANKPSQLIDVDKWGNIVETIHQDGFKKIITHKRAMPRI